MVQKGTIKIKTENGVKPVPIFEPSDVSLPIIRLETESGTAALELVDPQNVDTDADELNIKTSNHGVLSISHTKLKVDSSLNNQEAEITVREDTTGDGTADNTETVKVTDSGTFSYTLPGIRGGIGNEYWLNIELTNPNDITKSAEINSVELKV